MLFEENKKFKINNVKLGNVTDTLYIDYVFGDDFDPSNGTLSVGGTVVIKHSDDVLYSNTNNRDDFNVTYLNVYKEWREVVYDSDDGVVGVTESYLCLETEDETYYFVLEEYFSESDLATLFYYVRDTSDMYTVEAHIDKETKALAFLHFDHRTLLGEHTTVFEWKDASIIENEDMIVYRKKTLIRDIFSVPHYRIEDDEFWIDDTIKGKEYKETFSYETQSGEKEDYVVSIQSAEYSWKAAVNILAPVYLVGAVVMLIGICAMIYCLKRCGYTNVDKKEEQ